MGRRTPLFPLHQELGARIIDFGGWDMPLQYSSQLAEHHAVRRTAGVFDVSHMCAVDLTGGRTRPFLQHLLANDVGRLQTPGRALYSCMLNESGGVLDDLIVYRLDDACFRLVLNAGTRDRDLLWIRQQAAPFDVAVCERNDLALLAVQGPTARQATAALLGANESAEVLQLTPFSGRELGAWFIARTGYTGEDGFEIMLPAEDAEPAWRRLNAAGVTSCGLGARDTLRLEAGMNLYGSDMDETTHPFESGLGWTVARQPFDRDFIGRSALENISFSRQMVGLLLQDPGVLRGHQRVVTASGDGATTSGTWSPTLERSIALARVPAGCTKQVQVDVRGRLLRATVVRPPFVRAGQARIDLGGSI